MPTDELSRAQREVERAIKGYHAATLDAADAAARLAEAQEAAAAAYRQAGRVAAETAEALRFVVPVNARRSMKGRVSVRRDMPRATSITGWDWNPPRIVVLSHRRRKWRNRRPANCR